MTASISAAPRDEPAGVAPVSPVKVDIGELKAPLTSRIERLSFAGVFAVCLGLHAALLLLLEPQPQVSLVEEAIPVEVIIEPSPTEPAPQPEEARERPTETPAQTIDEPPATDFARAADQDREDGRAAELAAPEAKRPDQPKTEAAPEEPTGAPASPLPEPAEEAAAVEPRPAAKAPAFAAFAPLADLEFKAPPAKRSDLPSGKAQPGYLSTLYGLIMRKMPEAAKQARQGRGRVTFGVMSNGYVFQEAIVIPSGAPFLDAAALAAVRKAAPFPKPPNGGPVYLIFDY